VVIVIVVFLTITAVALAIVGLLLLSLSQPFGIRSAAVRRFSGSVCLIAAFILALETWAFWERPLV